jgi:hypothetical protein
MAGGRMAAAAKLWTAALRKNGWGKPVRIGG